MLDREIGLPHRLCGGRGRRFDSELPPGARQGFRGVTVHRIGIQQARQPLGLFLVPSVPPGELGQGTQGNDVLPIQLEDLLEHACSSRIVLLVDEAAGVDDMSTDIVGVELQAVLTEGDGVIYKSCFTIGVGQGSEIAALGIIIKARFELLDLAGVCHGLSLCGNWTKIVFGRRCCQMTGQFVRLSLFVVVFRLMPLHPSFM